MSSLCRFVSILLCVASCTSKTNQSPAEISVSASQKGNIEKGKVLYRTCSACHGGAAEGNARLHAPALTNLDSWYAYRQLKNFKKGIRGYLSQDSTGVQMATIAQSLKDTTEMQDLISYIESLADVKPVATAVSGNIKKGERTYQTVCGSCHGPGAKGNELMHAPRLNGLESWYIKSQMAKFKMSLRGAHADDIYGAPMIPMMTLLKDEQAIDDVIAYIESTVSIVSQ
jgi:cytochrome c oxidase subunit II